jgi:hypothetical protein
MERECRLPRVLGRRHPRADRGRRGLTCNEIAARFSTLIIKPVTGTRYGCDGRSGAVATTALNPAITGGKPGNRKRNDLRLEYHVPHVRE